MRTRRAFIGVVLLSAVGGCSMVPSGVGQHEVSPDGRYDAHATFYYNGSREWLVLEVRMAKSGKVVWKEDLGDRVDDHPPFDQGFG